MGESDTFLIISEPSTGVVVIAPTADVDMSRSPMLRTAIQQHMKPSTETLVVHLEDVGYMDSSGLATLVEAMRTGKATNTNLVLSAMGPKVLAIFEIARLESFFTIVAGIDEALQP
ncbi:MAG: STAS domain-containing protein [Phycisphaerales bacterium]|nr:STAS domain-containing protein [Phycisphaerales bacterium]